MKIRNNKTIIATAIASAIAVGAVSAQAAPNVDAIGQKQEDVRYIIKFKDSSVEQLKAAGFKGNNLFAAQRAANTSRLAQVGATPIKLLDRSNAAAAVLTKKQIAALKANPNVELVEKDPKRYLIDTISRSFAAPKAIEPQAESSPYGIALVQADQVSDANTGNMSVCITDSGYDGAHEDLLPYTDALITGDNTNASGSDTGNWWEPGHSHGTHVAGTIGALGNNGVGVIGVNPSGLLKLHNVKVFDNSGTWGYGSDLIAAIDQCSAAGSKIISMSLGGGDISVTEENAFIAFTDNGGINIAAAGNDANTVKSYPASYDSVMSVAALDENKNHAYFSQRNDQVEIAAPGVSVNSTVIGGTYASWDGTSMATPHVSGVAALVWSHFPQCTGNQIRNAMISTAEDLGAAGYDTSYGYGLIQAKAMYDALTSDGCEVAPPPPPPPPPGGALEKGVPFTGISGASGDQYFFTLDVPAGATDITFTMSGGTGDADMYVKFGSEAGQYDYDCRPFAYGNNESCTGTDTDGTYHIMINGYSSFDGASLVGDYEDGTTPPPPPPPPGGDDSYTNDADVQIIDQDTVESIIDVTGTGDSGNITVDVDIKHTYVGDLVVSLVAPSGQVSTLHNLTGASDDNIIKTYSIDATGIERNGQWKLVVEDMVYLDNGYIDSWTINF